MKYILSIILILLFFLSCRQNEALEHENGSNISFAIARLDTFPVPSSVRALEVVNDSSIWFAGSGGVFGYTENGGREWHLDSLRWDTLQPHFRSIAVTEEAVYLLSIASPALLFRSTDKGQSWRLVYREEDPAAFYDAMTFWDAKTGIAMGDPTNGCLSIIRTRDGGRTWRKIACDKLPPTVEGEAAYAASNSNIGVYGDHAWIVSGGAKARVFHTPDRGNTWEVFETPIVSGGQMTGIYSVDFLDEKEGIIFGGDWNEMENKRNNKAITSDGGATWQLIADGQDPGYRSCVRYAPKSEGQIIFATGIPGISYSTNGGTSWADLSSDSFYALRFGSDRNQIWLAGNQKIAFLKLEEQ